MSTLELQPDDSKCRQCSKASESLQRCGRCKTVCYCSKECQVAHWPTHKANCKRPNYLLHFHLCPDEIDDPPVTRTLTCPATATFHELHMALQIAFNWAGTHAYDFAVEDPTYEPDESDGMVGYIKRMMNRNPDPNLPREFLIRVSTPSNNSIMFQVDRMHEGWRKHPRTLEKDARKTRLFQVLDDDHYASKQ
jgi:hypothetical protein